MKKDRETVETLLADSYRHESISQLDRELLRRQVRRDYEKTLNGISRFALVCQLVARLWFWIFLALAMSYFAGHWLLAAARKLGESVGS